MKGLEEFMKELNKFGKELRSTAEPSAPKQEHLEEEGISGSIDETKFDEIRKRGVGF